MKQLFDYILRPSKIVLLLYGLLSFLSLTIYVWVVSFTWEIVFSLTFYIVVLLVLLLIGLAFAIYLDIHYMWKIKRYCWVSIIQLLFISILAIPIRAWQIDITFKNAKQIIEPLEDYKKQFGFYPTTLNQLGQKLNRSIPTRTNIGTRFNYTLDGKVDYNLSFVSYYGYTAYFNNTENKWILTD